ncbi:MAG: hypothetical protein GX308_08955, partial [Epulopiscium sp.]|nr:hypothetical protein [Candidatus Epulonipiscium sp.]
MNQIYQIRETIIGFYKTYEKVIFSILRFILSFIIFQFISRMGYAVVLTKMPVGILFGIIGTIISVQWFFLLIVVVICTHLAFVSIEAAVLVFVLSTIIYLLYIRLFPKQSLLIIALILGFYFRIPYVVPLFAGLFVGVSGIVPIIFGTLIWHFIPHIQSLIEMKSSELMEMPNTLANMYISTIQWLAKDQTTIITIIIFCVTVITVHLIAKLSIDYSWYIAIGIGAVVNLIGFLIGLLIVDIDI